MSIPFIPFKVTSARLRLPRIKVTVPKAAKNLAQMPLTIMGLGLIASAVTILTLTGGLMFIGIALIGLEYLIADEK